MLCHRRDSEVAEEQLYILLFDYRGFRSAEDAENKIHSPAKGLYFCSILNSKLDWHTLLQLHLLLPEWFFIDALSAAMKKDIFLCVLCASSEAGGESLFTRLPAWQSWDHQPS